MRKRLKESIGTSHDMMMTILLKSKNFDVYDWKDMRFRCLHSPHAGRSPFQVWI